MKQATTALALCLLLFACGSREQRLPDSAGGPDEVLVVMPKGHWESEPGAAVRALLEQPMAGVPQPEPRFRVAHCRPEDFSTLLRVHHSVIRADIGSDSTAFTALRDAHARGQLMIRVAAPRPGAWNELWQAKGHEAVAALEDHQRARTGERLRRERDAAVSGSIRSAMGIALDIPGGYRVVKQENGFAWLQRDRIMSGSGLEHNVIEGVLIHSRPYTSDSTWNVRYLVDLRDSVTRAHVEGPDPGSYMIVQRGFEQLDLMPTGRAVQLNGRFAYLMHGLFGMQGAKMGGPFVSLSTLDPSGTRIITVEGFAYAPQFDKRPYVRELEALLFSLRMESGATP
ncbi:MAG: DUF4837 family protein [Flavobacteriales bacterium]|nr:MAG: DUF4837 family protein [Flavobacteriales bacterium]